MNEHDKTSAERWARGLEIIEKVYGPGSSAPMQTLAQQPFVDETVCHLFADIWSRPGLSIRDKRLLVIGATAMLGRADLIATQVAGAIQNGELTDVQLDEIPLLMLFYAGAGNTTALFQGIQTAKTKMKERKPG